MTHTSSSAESAAELERHDAGIASIVDEHLSAVLGAMSDALAIFDADWRICYVNTGAAQALDRSPEQILGRRIDELVPEVAGSAVEARLHEAMQRPGAGEAGEPIVFEHWFEPWGRWYKVRAMRDGDRLLVFWRDITEKRQATLALAESEQRHRLVSSLTSDYAVSYRVGDGGELELEWRIGDFPGVTGHRSEEVPGLAQAIKHLHREDVPALRNLLTRLRSGEAGTLQVRLIGADGEQRWVRLHGHAIKDEAGRVVRIVGAIQNITEQQRIEQVLRDSEAWFRQTIDGMAAAVYVTDCDGRILRFNHEAARLWGREPRIGVDGDLYCGSLRIYTADGEPMPPEHCPMAQTLRTGEPVPAAEIVIERPDGERITALANPSPVRDDDGRMIGAVNCFIDITERRRAEQALRRSEARERARAAELATLMDSVPAVIFTAHDPEAKRITGSRLAYEFFRVPPGTNLSLSTEPEERPETFRVFQDGRELPAEQLPVQRAARGEWVRREELEIRFADGPSAFLIGNASPVLDERGDVRGSIAAMVDITDHKRTEQELREHRERLQFTLEAADVGTWEWDLLTNQVHWSDNLEAVHRLEPGTFDGTFENYLRRIHPEDAPNIRRAIQQAVAGVEPYHVEYRERLGDGSITWLEGKGRLVRDERGQPARLTGVCMNITERKHREQQMLESERRFRAVFHGAQDPVLVYRLAPGDKPGPFLEVNDAALRFYGYDAETFRTKSVFDLRVDSDAPRWFSQYVQQMREHKSVLIEAEHRTSDGRSVPVEVRGQLLTLAGEPAILSVVRDITRHKRQQHELESFNERLEQQVRQRTVELERHAAQLQRMAKELTDAEQRERRRLAQLLHDDLQQILVAARLRLAAARSPDDESRNAIIKEAEDLIAQSITTSRSLSTELAPPALYDLGLEAALEWLARWVESKYGLVVELDCDDGADVSTEQVRVLVFSAVRELLLNVVKHANVRHARLSLTCDDDRLRCAVEDDGRGFDIDAIRNDHQASGFGLFSIQERLKLLGGSVHIASEPGQGTRVEITVALEEE
ncbi:MAG: PAS domain S-box protein [Phycisphaeraceae bacterium]